MSCRIHFVFHRCCVIKWWDERAIASTLRQLLGKAAAAAAAAAEQFLEVGRDFEGLDPILTSVAEPADS